MCTLRKHDVVQRLAWVLPELGVLANGGPRAPRRDSEREDLEEKDEHGGGYADVGEPWGVRAGLHDFFGLFTRR